MLSHRLTDLISRSIKPPKLIRDQTPRRSDPMEKKDLLGVRKRPTPAAAAAAKRRRKVVAPAKAGAGGIAKAIAVYLASDSYMYAPLVSAPPSPPPPPAADAAAAPPISTPEKEVTLVQKYRGSWQATFTAY